MTKNVSVFFLRDATLLADMHAPHENMTWRETKWMLLQHMQLFEARTYV